MSIVGQLLVVVVFSRPVMSDSFATPWTVVLQVPLSTGFPRQEYWSELPFPSPEDLPNPGIESESSALAGSQLQLIQKTEASSERTTVSHRM